MPAVNHFSRLPDDLVAGVLAFLPIRQAARARLVCRRWRALTTEDHFVRTVFSRSRHHAAARFFFNYRSEDIVDYFPIDRDGEAGTAGDRLTPGLSFIPGTSSANRGGALSPLASSLSRESMQVYGSCGGCSCSSAGFLAGEKFTVSATR